MKNVYKEHTKTFQAKNSVQIHSAYVCTEYSAIFHGENYVFLVPITSVEITDEQWFVSD